MTDFHHPAWTDESRFGGALIALVLVAFAANKILRKADTGSVLKGKPGAGQASRCSNDLAIWVRVLLIATSAAPSISLRWTGVGSLVGGVAIANTLHTHISYTNEQTSLTSGRGKRSNKPAGSP
jgi:hypothetical protein